MIVLTALSLVFTAFQVEASQAIDTWEIDRPRKNVALIDRVENASTNDEASVGMGIDIQQYSENIPGTPYDGGDGLRLAISGTANTRKGIEYYHQHFCRLMDGFPDPQYMYPTNITGDNDGKWIDIPFCVYFYGGPAPITAQNKSAFYNKVWVCSNGFLSFQSSSVSPNPSIPNPEEPNAVIAPYWTDLDPSGGSIKYFACSGQYPTFIVAWYDVLNRLNGARETFAVIITNEMTSSFGYRGQNKIKFLYKSVSGQYATIGIEDQEGYRGYKPLPDEYGNVKSEDEIWLLGGYDAPEIREMAIVLEKSDNQARIYVVPGGSYLRGYNLDWKTQEQDPQGIYEQALKGAFTLLMSKVASYGNPFGGLMFGTAVLGYDLLKSYAKEHWPVNYLYHKDAMENENIAYINVSAEHYVGYDWPVDAALSDCIDWIFIDQNNDQPHSIKVYAFLKYYSYKYTAMKTICTSVTIKVIPDIGNDFASASWIGQGNYKRCLDNVDTADVYKISIPSNYYIILTLQPAPDANYDLYLYSSGQTVAESENGGNSSEYIRYHVNSVATYYVKVKQTYWPDHVNEGIYQLGIELEPPREACPFVYVWNGQQYIIDNNLLPTSLKSNGADVEDYYKLEQIPIPKHQGTLFSVYSLQIREFENEHSCLDQFKLLAVDHNPDFKIAVTPDGEIVNYRKPLPPISCIDNNGDNRLSEILFMDGNVSDSLTYFDGYRGDYLILNFSQIDAENAKLILRSDRKCENIDLGCCIEVQVLNNSEWQKAALVAPREYWATEAVNLSPYVNAKQDL